MSGLYSDMHRIIEHVQSDLQRVCRATLRNDASINIPNKYVDLHFKSFCSLGRDGIARDVQSLPDTYGEIVRVKRGWLSKSFRCVELDFQCQAAVTSSLDVLHLHNIVHSPWMLHVATADSDLCC